LKLIILLFCLLSFTHANLEERYYRLLVNTFLGAKDLDNAVKVLQEAVKKFPKDPKWWELYAQVLVWSNKNQEALEAYYEGYKKTKDPKLAKKAFELSLSFNRFDIARELMDVVETPSEVRAYVFEQLGDVENLLKALDSKKTKENLLRKAQIEFTIGRKEKAEETILEYYKLYGKDQNSVMLLANIYYSQKEFEKALRVLKEYLPEAKEEEAEFFRTLSDLGWMLQDYEVVAFASERLIKLGKAEISDYDRLSDIYLRTDPKKSLWYALEGYKKFDNLFLLKKSIFYAFSSGLYQDTARIFQEHRDKLLEDTNAIYSYVISLQNLGERAEALKELENFTRKLQAPDLIALYVYLLVENQEVKKLERALKDYSQFASYPQVAQAFAVGYVSLQEGQKALHYYRLSGSEDRLLLADIKYTLGLEEEARAIRYETYKNLIRDEEVWEDREKLRTYLSLAIEFEKPEIFERKLQRAKGVLSEPVWREIYLVYLFSKEQREKAYNAHRLYKYSLKPWMWLNLALWEDNRYMMLNLLEKMLESLPTRDRVQALKLVGQPKRALEEAFKGLEKNPYDYQLYKQFRDLVLEEANQINFELSNINRKQYGELVETFSVKFNTGYRKYRVGINLSAFQPTYRKRSEILRKVGGYLGEFYMEQRFQRGQIRLAVGQMERLRTVQNFMFYGQRYLFYGLSAGLELGYRRQANESLYLTLGGMKDYAKLNLNFNPFNRLVLYSSAEYSQFYSQDKKKLGEGFYAYNQVSYKLRVAYPDYTLRLFYTFGNYQEKNTDKGVIKQLSPFQVFRVLPENYYSLGAGFSFGYEHKQSYTRSWRPFFDASIGYTSSGGGLALSTEVGVGGALFSQDNLSLSISGSRNIGGVEDEIIRLNLTYKLFF